MKHLISILLAFSLIFSFIPAVSASDAIPLSSAEWQLLLLTNRERLAENLDPLTATSSLQAACDIRAEELVKFFSHTRPDGSSCFSVLSEVGLSEYASCGENIAAGHSMADSVTAAWMNSAGHRKNILSSSYAHIGVGQINNDDSYGTYWVQFFYKHHACEYTSMEINADDDLQFKSGTGIDEMHLTAKLTCKFCGTCYLPIMSEFCSGYDLNALGKQTIVLTCLGFETSFEVTLVGHVHEYTANVIPSTCTSQGYTAYICSCGKTYCDNYTAPLGHSYRDGVCVHCGELDSNYIPAPVAPDNPQDEVATPVIVFDDVSTSAWYYSAVNYAVSNRLMNGMGNNKFEPETGMTRAMLVTVLWRYAGKPIEGENIFNDLKEDWYIDAVKWAAHNGIVNGVGKGKFDPDAEITREQMAVILFRYANKLGIDTSARGDLAKFADKNAVFDYAVEALQWAVGAGVVGGSSEGGKLYLNPQNSATRAEVATLLMRYIENVLQ